MRTRRGFLGLLGVGVAGCAGSPGDGSGGSTDASEGVTIQATPFDDGGSIPARYTCEGGDVNPELTASNVPADADSLALVVDDPDAGEEPFVHWLLWNLPAEALTIPRSVAKTERVVSLDAVQGTNGAGDVGYTGPCPPESDGPHTYRFHLRALDTTLEVDPRSTRSALADAMDGHVLAGTTLAATYERD
jgi:Raf kinase inhibitor-like YbhB/YbcL family protein